MTQTLENCTENKTTQKTLHYSDLENKCVFKMSVNGFHNVDLPLDTSGGKVSFAGRDGDSRKLEWYKASMQDDGTLFVTYNSHHDLLHRDKNFVFRSRLSKPFDEKEKRELSARCERVAKMNQEREFQEEKERCRKALRDRERFNKASEIGISPYLERKQVKAHGIHFEIGEQETVILVPMLDENGEIQTIQEIYPTKRLIGKHQILRDKNFTNATKGLFHTIGDIVDGQEIRVSEGYATAASCFESTGGNTPHVVAFSANAYRTIIPIIRKLYPNSPILICADNNNHNNPYEGVGVREAKKTADLVGNCLVIYPIFPEGKNKNEAGESYSDFNDLMIVSGKEEVKRQIEQIKPERSKLLNDDEKIEEHESEEPEKELVKANAAARRRALMYQSSHEGIIKDICKQYPSLKDRAQEIANKALVWAEKYQAGCDVIVGGIPKKITDMTSLDSRFAQLEAAGQPCVTIHRMDAQPISTVDFKKRLSGEVVLSGVDEKGQPKFLDASKFWEGNAHKFIYRSIVFTNKQVGNETYNLFTGFGIKPQKGNCEKIFSHIKDIICAGDEINNTALLKLLAWQMQNIGKPSRIITALKSNVQQAGKGCLLSDILAVIYGNSGFVTNDIGQIIARFNDAIRGKAFIFLDEALFAGDLKAADSIKSLATATRQGVESKGVPIVQFPIAINLFLATNHDDAAHVEESDARYWILEVSPHRAGNTEYFKDLYEEIEGGGRQAFMHYLLNLDVKDFIPSRDVPIDNAFKAAMIRNSINPYDARKWLEECCLTRMIIGHKPKESTVPYEKSNLPWTSWISGVEYENGVFAAAYTQWQTTVKAPTKPKPTPANKFGEFLNKAGLALRIDGARFRTLPDPNECLEKVIEMIENRGEKAAKK